MLSGSVSPASLPLFLTSAPDPQPDDCVWQQELYTTFEYKSPRPYFHTFEADVSAQERLICC